MKCSEAIHRLTARVWLGHAFGGGAGGATGGVCWLKRFWTETLDTLWPGPLSPLTQSVKQALARSLRSMVALFGKPEWYFFC